MSTTTCVPPKRIARAVRGHTRLAQYCSGVCRPLTFLCGLVGPTRVAADNQLHIGIGTTGDLRQVGLVYQGKPNRLLPSQFPTGRFAQLRDPVIARWPHLFAQPGTREQPPAIHLNLAREAELVPERIGLRG